MKKATVSQLPSSIYIYMYIYICMDIYIYTYIMYVHTYVKIWNLWERHKRPGW